MLDGLQQIDTVHLENITISVARKELIALDYVDYFWWLLPRIGLILQTVKLFCAYKN